MRVALITISDRGELYRPRMMMSLAQHVRFDFDQTIEVDDREHRLGMAGAVNEAWRQVGDDIDYVFHVEEDFLFLRDVSVERMCRTLEANPHLAQFVLKRPPWSDEERAAGGIIEMHPDEYEDRVCWQEHTRLFSLNPCVYPRWVCEKPVPFDSRGIERVITDRLVPEGYRFGMWGSRAESPYCEHIGHQRGTGWRL